MQFCSTLCWFANILCNSIFLHMCKLVHGGQKWAFIQVERCKQWLYIQSWWWWLDAREHFWTVWSFCLTESYSHVVRWSELTVGCEVNNHSPSPVQGERGWVHCVHKNWSRLNAKRHHDILWTIFKAEKTKSIYTHENPLYVEDWTKFVFADHCREVHLRIFHRHYSL